MPGNSLKCLPAYRAAEALEERLGDPFDSRTPFSLAAAASLDEREEFPEAFVSQLQEFGYLDRMVPRDLGGAFGSFEEACALQRAVARRDLTTAIALGQTFLGSVPIWLAGTADQKERQAALLLSGGLAALALTEEAHGADVLQSEVRAEPDAGGIRLWGTKWLINNGTRAQALTVFAREGDLSGLSGFSLFVVDKSLIAAGALVPLSKKRTLGIRGADISGVALHGALIPAAARIGAAGAGADLLLQSLQLTRVGCCSFSLGAADTALRLALDFSLSRQLYGASVSEIPHARDALAGAFIDLLVADCVATAAARAVHAAPEQLSLFSSVAKVFVPTQVETILRALSAVLGARYYLREGIAGGAFQKIVRDAAVVPLFDGSVPVNLDSIGTQLLRLSPRHAASPADREAALAGMFRLDQELPDLDPGRLALLNAGRDDVTQGLSDTLARMDALPAFPLKVELVALFGATLDQQSRAGRELAELALGDRKTVKRSAELFALAHRHCTLFAAASCAELWLRSANLLGDYVAHGAWLALALDRLLAPLLPSRAPRRNPHLDGAFTELVQRQVNARAFSITPLQLAR